MRPWHQPAAPHLLLLLPLLLLLWSSLLLQPRLQQQLSSSRCWRLRTSSSRVTTLPPCTCMSGSCSARPPGRLRWRSPCRENCQPALPPQGPCSRHFPPHTSQQVQPVQGGLPAGRSCTAAGGHPAGTLRGASSQPDPVDQQKVADNIRCCSHRRLCKQPSHRPGCHQPALQQQQQQQQQQQRCRQEQVWFGRGHACSCQGRCDDGWT